MTDTDSETSFAGGVTDLFKSLAICLVASCLFSCLPAIYWNRDVQLPPAYELKSHSPLADTATLTIPNHPGERSHGAKLTPRLLSAIALYGATSLSLHPYLPATLGGVAFLACGIIVGTRLTRDRHAGLWMGLLLAGLYASNACFAINHGPKPFDGIAIGLVAIAMMLVDRPVGFAIAAYLACWTDERAIVSLVLIGAMCLVRQDYGAAMRKSRWIMLAGVLLIYALTRLALSRALGWTASDTSMLGVSPIAALSYAQMAGWTAFEGGWALCIVAAALAMRRGAKGDANVLAASVVIAITSCLVVLDISRASAFTFPVLFIALAILVKHAQSLRPFIRPALMAAAIVTLVSSNVEIISGIAYTPLPTLPIALLMQWFGG